MATVITGTNQRVSLGNGYSLRAPGLRGEAEQFAANLATTRAASRIMDSTLAALDDALKREGVAEVRRIDLALRPAIAAGTASLRSAAGEPELELQVPDLGPEVGQIVVSVDDLGGVRWHLPGDDASSGAASRGAGAVRTFRIPASFATVPTESIVGQRSLFGAMARRLLKVLVYPITDPILGAIGQHFAARWEAAKRPYRLRSFTPENFRDASVASLSRDELATLVKKDDPMLLFIHGTFSTAHGGFGGLPTETMSELHRRYAGRVVAFDHPTLADAPDDNVRWLLKELPAASMQCDIVCHSRGGLVSRVLSERLTSFDLDASRVDVRRVVFAGTPNAGTALADADHMVAMIDRLTTALTLAPTGPVTETFEALVTVIKVLGHSGLKGLKGLASMHPKGPFLGSLNKVDARRAEYYAIAADYEPADRGLRALVSASADHLIDQIFDKTPNDLVVPTEGVWHKNGGAGFPFDAKHVLAFKPSDGVMHTNFFLQPAVSEKLLAWLT